MLSFPGTLKVYLATDPTDLRKSFSGLWAVAANEMKENPQNGALYVFANRRRTRIKILYFDGTGVWVMANYLSSHCISSGSKAES